MINSNIQPYNIFPNAYSNTIVPPNSVNTWDTMEINKAYNEFKKLQSNIYDVQMYQQLVQKMQQLMYKMPLQLHTTPPFNSFYYQIGNPVLQDTINTLVNITGWNYEAVTLTVLSFLNSAMRGRFFVHANANWLEHMPLYTMLVAESGTMKSKLFEILCAPFIAKQTRLIVEFGDISKREKLEKGLCNGVIKSKREEYVKLLLATMFDDYGNLDKEAILSAYSEFVDDMRDLEMVSEEQYTRVSSIITDASTDINLMKKMMRNGGGISIFSAEGEKFMTHYSKGINHNDLLNKAYDLEPVAYGSELNQIEIAHPFITIMLLAQMKIVHNFFNKPTVHESGLGARFMTIIPTQLQACNPLAEELVFDEYNALITEILEACIGYCMQGKFFDLYLTDGASRILQNFRDEIQDMMYAEHTQIIKYTLRKLAGTALRIAATIHVVNNWHTPCDYIDEYTMTNAVSLAKYAFECKRFLCEPLGYSAVINANKILKWVKRHRHHVFTSRDIAQQTDVRTTIEIFPALDLLEAHNIIAQVITPNRARLIGINPCIIPA
ncbi:MAG: DUF3987 domain-containing protein [Desulfovibrio sp.]|nr:DUF3987 domain-containing protein [Desulfovibrio sp.]